MRGLEEASIEAAMLETNSVMRMLVMIVLPQLKTCILAVFLAIMIPLSLFGDDLYRMTLPGVVVGTPTVEKAVEEITLEGGTIIKQSYVMLTVPAGAVKETISATGEKEATVFCFLGTLLRLYGVLVYVPVSRSLL